MANYSTSEFKGGLKLMLDGDPCSIIENEIVKPGKGQAFNRVKFRNLKTGRVIERTFKSGESLEAADVVELDMQFLYNDGEFFHFMDPESFEQYQADENAVADAKLWLKDQATCILTLWNGAPISVAPPPSHPALQSTCPAETGIPGAKPVCSAASPVTSPMSSSHLKRSGIRAGSMPISSNNPLSNLCSRIL